MDGALIAAGSPYGCGMEKDEEDSAFLAIILDMLLKKLALG